jgi:hypothetical protein
MFLLFKHSHNPFKKESIIKMTWYILFKKRNLTQKLINKVISLINIKTIIHFSFIINNADINTKQLFIMQQLIQSINQMIINLTNIFFLEFN